MTEIEGVLADYIGSPYAVAVGSGTDALIFALKAAGVKSYKGYGHQVVVPAFTFSATAAAVALIGADIVFADIREEDFGIDINTVRDPEIIKAIIVVDMFGIPADWDNIYSVCNDHGIIIIEDAAQAIGAKYHGVMCGNLGAIGCTSFYPSKPLSCIGDGGMIFTPNSKDAKQIRMIANHGRQADDKYRAERLGKNSRLDTIQAAVLLERFSEFKNIEIPCRISQAHAYMEKVYGVKHVKIHEGVDPVWSWYPVLYPTQDERDAAFQEFGGYLGARVIYPEPLHLMPAFKYLRYKEGDFPVAEDVCHRILAFPIVHHWEVNRCLAMIMNAGSANPASR